MNWYSKVNMTEITLDPQQIQEDLKNEILFIIELIKYNRK